MVQGDYAEETDSYYGRNPQEDLDMYASAERDLLHDVPEAVRQAQHLSIKLSALESAGTDVLHDDQIRRVETAYEALKEIMEPLLAQLGIVKDLAPGASHARTRVNPNATQNFDERRG